MTRVDRGHSAIVADRSEDEPPAPAAPRPEPRAEPAAAPLAYDTTRALGPDEARAAPSSPAMGQRIGRYQLGRLLGQGGMGVVYRARDPELDRALAIKLVQAGGGSAGHARVLREAQAMARLRHPHVVPVFDVGVHDGAVFLVMPLLEGGTLGAWMRGGRRPWREVVARFLAAARGLAAAHAVGLVHRDFKPDNVLLGAGDEVQVADFGLARAVRGADDDRAQAAAEPGDDGGARSASPLSSDVTAAGTVLGTPAYMAPEQLDGAVVDARADQFSFCVALYEGLYRQRPFEADGRATDLITLRDAIRVGPARPAKADGDVPGWLRAIVVRGLREAPGERWPSMAALIAAIERRLRRPRRIALAGLAAVAGAGLVTMAIVVARGAGGGRPAAPPTSPAPGYALDRATRVTFAGCAAQPTFAPAGDRIAYVQRRGAASTLIVRDLGTGAERSLGPGAEPAFSPDGRRLAAFDGGRVVILDLADPAAAPRPLGPTSSAPRWLDDATVVVGVGDRVIARAVGDGSERELGRVPEGHLVRATAVGGGRLVVIHRPDASLAEAVVAEVRPDRSLRELRRGVLSTAGVHLDPAGADVYYVQRRNSNQYQVFIQPLAGGDPSPISTDTTPAGGFDVAPDRRRLAYSSCAEAARIVALPRTGAARDVTAGGAWRDNAPLPLDANHLIHTSTRAGLIQLWLLDRATGDDRPLVPPESSQPALSPDRVTLAYAAVTDGNLLGLRIAPLARLATASAAPSPATVASVRPLTDGHVDRGARFSRDGATVVFLRETDAGQALYRIATAGGEATPLIAGPASAPPSAPAPAPAPVEVRAFDLSPVDDRVVYVAAGDTASPLWQVALDGSGRAPVAGAAALGAAIRLVRFTADGRRLLVVDADRRLLELDLATGAVAPRWQVDGSEFSAIGAAAYDVDGNTVLASLTSRAGDLWIGDGRF